MTSDSTTVIKNMEFLVKELHKEWDRSGASKASVIISIEEVDGINDKLKEIIYQTQKSVDEDELTFKQSMAKSKECYVLLRVVRKIAKKKDKCEKQAIDNEFAIELDKDELKLFKLSREEYVKRSKAMVEQIDELHQEIEQLKTEIPPEDNSSSKFETQLESIINMESFDREKIQKIIKKVIINGEDNIEIVWNTDDPFFK